MTFERAEKYRVMRPIAHLPPTKTGNRYGMFIMGVPGQTQVRMMVCDGEETSWEHVSVSKLVVGKKGRVQQVTPSWEEMCVVKDLFWDAEDCVVQFHPPKSQYVNTHANCLHLWKAVGDNWKTPDQIYV